MLNWFLILLFRMNGGEGFYVGMICVGVVSRELYVNFVL